MHIDFSPNCIETRKTLAHTNVNILSSAVAVTEDSNDYITTSYRAPKSNDYFASRYWALKKSNDYFSTGY
jgi:hypothetical protein